MAEVDEDSLIYQDFDKSNQTYTIKLLMIGDQCVGKSSLQLCFSGDAFNASFLHTIGIEFRIRTIELDGKKIKLQIWNIVGQERFRTVTAAYYRGTKGCMLVYDITNERSFNNIRNWMREMEEYAPRDVEKMILGNKCDKCDRRQVSKERGEKLAIEHGFKFMETSGKYNINVEDAFYTLARDIKAKMDRQIDASSLPKGGNERKLTAQDQPKKCTIL